MTGHQRATRLTGGILLAWLSFQGVGTAQSTVPLTFKDGDVVSADVLNAIFKRINESTGTFSSTADLVGTWSCVETTPAGDGACPANTKWTTSPLGLSTSRTQTYTFSRDGAYYKLATSAGAITTCTTGAADAPMVFDAEVPQNSNFLFVCDRTRGTCPSQGGLSGPSGSDRKEIRHISATSMLISVMPSTAAVCTKQSIPPLPVDNLTATVSGTSVMLTWTDQSTDETGFKVQRKSSANSTFATLATAAANATTYTDVTTAGVYSYRVFATNASGDSISSSEVQVTVR